MKAGITGLIDRPAEGAKEEGLAGFIAGMAKGIVGAVAAPVAGALGAVSRVTEGVDASTRYRGRGVLRTGKAGVLDSVTSHSTWISLEKWRCCDCMLLPLPFRQHRFSTSFARD